MSAINRVEKALAGSDQPAEIDTLLLPPPWPELGADAYHGVLGEIVRIIEPQTEADPAGILLQLIAAVGNAIGRGPHFQIEGDQHRCGFFIITAGDTAAARKGTAWSRVRQVMQLAAPEWARSHVKSGLVSGEGVIHHVRDRRATTKEDGTEVVLDEGATIKNILITETEFGRVVKRMNQDGNTLSAVIRQAWDGHTLASLGKHSPDQAAEAHISIIGHITGEELHSLLGVVESFNGFSNRFLWAAVRRSKRLPRGGQGLEEQLRPHTDELGRRIVQASGIGSLQWGEAAGELWDQHYDRLTEGRQGLFGAATARATAQVLRLAILYALLDGRAVIDEPHLHAALAIWEYCEASALRIFGQPDADPAVKLADEILTMLRKAPDGMVRTEINKGLGGHTPSKEIMDALTILRDRGLAVGTKVKGSKKETWRPLQQESANTDSADSPATSNPPTRPISANGAISASDFRNVSPCPVSNSAFPQFPHTPLNPEDAEL